MCSVPQVSSTKYHTKAISTFHQINAFEEDGFLMLDICCQDDGEAINNYLIQNLRKSGEALDEVGIYVHTHRHTSTPLDSLSDISRVILSSRLKFFAFFYSHVAPQDKRQTVQEESLKCTHTALFLIVSFTDVQLPEQTFPSALRSSP